jgi:hypothetical protein
MRCPLFPQVGEEHAIYDNDQKHTEVKRKGMHPLSSVRNGPQREEERTAPPAAPAAAARSGARGRVRPRALEASARARCAPSRRLPP